MRRNLTAKSIPSEADDLARRITLELEEDIIFGRLKPGQKLPEEELSELQVPVWAQEEAAGEAPDARRAVRHLGPQC